MTVRVREKRRGGRPARYGLLAGLVLFSGLICAETLPRGEEPPPTIAIILDDMGNNLASGKKANMLPPPINLAFLPGSPHSRELAAESTLLGHEVMLHMPMQNHRSLKLGPMALTEEMSNQAIVGTLRQALQAVPGIKGVNNHMGSRLTENAPIMRLVMRELRQHPLYFVDSRTTAATEAENSAREVGVPVLRRDVFLDNTATLEAIDRQFDLLLQKARENGFAVAIGHPYPQTLRLLERRLPDLGARGFAQASVSALLDIRRRTRDALQIAEQP